MDGEHVEPVEEISAEALLHDVGFEVPVGRANDPHIDWDRLGASDTLDLSFLDNAQKLRLCVEGQLANLVEEEGSPLGELEPPHPPLQRTSECSLLVAEEFALDQGGRDRSAIDLHEFTSSPQAEVVQRAGEQFLPGAGFAEQQHGGRRGRYALDVRQYTSDRDRSCTPGCAFQRSSQP